MYNVLNDAFKALIAFIVPISFNFCTEFNCIISDVEVLGITSDAFTFLSEAHGSTSWLDHCISSVQVHNCIESIKVNYDVLSSDHFPLSVCVKVDGIRAEHVGTNNVHLSRCNWSKAEDVTFTRCKDCCESLLSCVHIPVCAGVRLKMDPPKKVPPGPFSTVENGPPGPFSTV